MVAYRRIVSAKASSRADAAETDLESGIDRLLKQLEHVNTQMQAWLSSGGSEMVSHTLTQHQEILQDLTQEFYRLKSSLRGKKEHASLLDDFREFDQTPLDLEEESLLKERATISRSTGQMDNVISQAQATLGALVMQHSTFVGINSKISYVTSHLPMVNQLLSAIKRKKCKDVLLYKQALYVTYWCLNYLLKRSNHVKIIEACILSALTSIISFGLPLPRKCSPFPEADPMAGSKRLKLLIKCGASVTGDISPVVAFGWSNNVTIFMVVDKSVGYLKLDINTNEFL